MVDKLIFLDIDGVLTTFATSFRTGDPSCVALLNRITELTSAAIVVSSSWRHDPKIADTLKSWGVAGEVIGITPDLARPSSQSGIVRAVERGLEIALWLQHHAPDARFVILDDENDMAHLSHHLVRTDSKLGLQRKDAILAVLMLTNCDHPCQDYFNLYGDCDCTARAKKVNQEL